MLRSIVKGTFVSTQVLNKFMDILLKCKKKKNVWDELDILRHC